MELVISNIDDINKYNPYGDLSEFIESEYFEDKFLEYYNNFCKQVEDLKRELNHKYDKKIDRLFNEVVRNKNNLELEKILDEYMYLYTDDGYPSIEEEIIKLKKRVRTIKDMILISEPSNMRRLQSVDKKTNDAIDKISTLIYGLKPKLFDGNNEEELINVIKLSKPIDIHSYDRLVAEVRKNIEMISNFYDKNYSIKMSSDKTKKINLNVNKILDNNAIRFGYYESVLRLMDQLVSKYKDKNVSLSDFNEWVSEFKIEINNMKMMIKNIFSNKLSNKLIKKLDTKTGALVDTMANSFGMKKNYEDRLKEIFDTYKPDELDIFDIVFYSSEEERNEAREKYKWMTDEQKKVFEMRIYEQYIRLFKAKIRDLNNDVRKVYSSKKSNKLVRMYNRTADKLISDKAKKIGKPIPKNPWIIRKYLWVDKSNFITNEGVLLRKFINPLLRNVVRLAMKNKIIIEERSKLDPNKQYIFVSTHYFTEDVIGLFSSIGRQAYMLMGTTDQIENNPLMLAAVGFGFFHVDRMDKVSRKECVEKQNRIIDHGASFINYVSGSWQTSENELQPLSFSGPYRTSVAKNVEIVPVASYLVEEKKEIYIRYGDPLDLKNYDEETANMIIRNTLGSMHYKQMSKHCVPIETIELAGVGKTHNLPYDQHTYYMDKIGNEYWNQPWSKPFAKEEIGPRPKKVLDEADVYSFVDDLSRDKLIELSKYLAEPMLRRYERDERYNIIKYIDENYDRFKINNSKVRTRKKCNRM